MGDAVSRSMLRHAKRGLAPRRTESTKAALFLIAAAFLVVLPFVSAEVGGGAGGRRSDGGASRRRDEDPGISTHPCSSWQEGK